MMANSFFFYNRFYKIKVGTSSKLSFSMYID